MVRRALSHRRGGVAPTLEVDTASSPGYVTIPVILRTGCGTARRESLPLSRHHQLRRSSSVCSSSGAGAGTGTGTGRSTGLGVVGGGDVGGKLGGGVELYDGGSVIVDDIEEGEERRS